MNYKFKVSSDKHKRTIKANGAVKAAVEFMARLWQSGQIEEKPSTITVEELPSRSFAFNIRYSLEGGKVFGWSFSAVTCNRCHQPVSDTDYDGIIAPHLCNVFAELPEDCTSVLKTELCERTAFDTIAIKPVVFLGADRFAKVNGVVEKYGGQYVGGRNNFHWLIKITPQTDTLPQEAPKNGD